MTCLSLGYYNYSLKTKQKQGSIQDFIKKKSKSCCNLITLSCHQSQDEPEKKKKPWLSMSFEGVEKFRKGLKKNLSPKQKGDWKDVMLMSLSFAVYVYISQAIVSSYILWNSMPNPSW
ncbi:hypothetical protein ACFE04_002530 [Oxalis oulophora]